MGGKVRGLAEMTVEASRNLAAAIIVHSVARRAVCRVNPGIGRMQGQPAFRVTAENGIGVLAGASAQQY